MHAAEAAAREELWALEPRWDGRWWVAFIGGGGEDQNVNNIGSHHVNVGTQRHESQCVSLTGLKE